MYRVVICSIFYPMTMMLYFKRAFERREDVELWTCGPFTGTWIPWNNGMHLSQKYAIPPDFALPKDAITKRVPSKMLEKNLPWKPDLWINIDAGFHPMDKPDAKKVVLVQTDPHCLKRHYTVPIRYSDEVFCMQTPYKTPDEKFLPYAFDPTVHYPEEMEKKHDACLIGLNYQTRASLIQRLRARKISVYQGIGEIMDEYRDRYNESRIALSWSSKLDLPARVWEAMGMGIPILTNRVPDLKLFFEEGEDYLGFDTVEEAEKQAIRLLTSKDLREQLAGSALEKVNNGHTWDDRVEKILEVL